eukprot:1161622-Pelagomonas_calceolata.AAC.6
MQRKAHVHVHSLRGAEAACQPPHHASVPPLPTMQREVHVQVHSLRGAEAACQPPHRASVPPLPTMQREVHVHVHSLGGAEAACQPPHRASVPPLPTMQRKVHAQVHSLRGAEAACQPPHAASAPVVQHEAHVHLHLLRGAGTNLHMPEELGQLAYTCKPLPSTARGHCVVLMLQPVQAQTSCLPLQDTPSTQPEMARDRHVFVDMCLVFDVLGSVSKLERGQGFLHTKSQEDAATCVFTSPLMSLMSQAQTCRAHAVSTIFDMLPAPCRRLSTSRRGRPKMNGI